jgi:hypothetical protein
MTQGLHQGVKSLSLKDSPQLAWKEHMHKTTTLCFQSIVIRKICCTIIFLLTLKQQLAKNPITPSNPIKIVPKKQKKCDGCALNLLEVKQTLIL